MGDGQSSLIGFVFGLIFTWLSELFKWRTRDWDWRWLDAIVGCLFALLKIAAVLAILAFLIAVAWNAVTT